MHLGVTRVSVGLHTKIALQEEKKKFPLVKKCKADKFYLILILIKFPFNIGN